MNKSFKFLDYDCQIVIYHYSNDGALAIELVSAVNDKKKDISAGESIAVASVNLYGLQNDEVAIKNYSENEGILDILLSHKLIDPSHRSINSGFVIISVHKYNMKEIEKYLFEA